MKKEKRTDEQVREDLKRIIMRKTFIAKVKKGDLIFDYIGLDNALDFMFQEGIKQERARYLKGFDNFIKLLKDIMDKTKSKDRTGSWIIIKKVRFKRIVDKLIRESKINKK